MSVKVKINKKFFSKLKDKEVKKLLKIIGSDMVLETTKNFRNEKTPNGEKWERLKPATIKSRRKGRVSGTPKILQDTRNLYLSLNKYKIEGKKVTVGTNVNYAAVHQYGSEELNIPSREYLGISDRKRDKYSEIIAEFVREVQQKKARGGVK